MTESEPLTVVAEPDPPPARLTVITATQPARLAKSYSLDPEGHLVKRGAGAMVEGRAEVVTVAGLDDLARVLAGLTPSQAVTHGVPAEAPVDLVTREAWVAAGRPRGKLPRTNETFGWPAGPGVLMLDHDPPPGGAALSRDDLVAAIRAAAPGLADTAMLWWCSASSHVTNTATGEDLTGLRGQRLYLLVRDGRDIPRAGAALVERLWAAGHGHIQVSASGALLERTVIDATTFQPSRLDFAAGAHCVPPLRQDRGEPVVIPGAVEVVDTREAIPDPDPATKRQGEAHKAAAKRAARPESDTAKARWIDARVAEMVPPDATEADHEAARRIAVQVLERATLAGDFQLTVVQEGRRETVTVGAILDDPLRWHHARTLDPAEPEYDGGRVVGRLHLMGSRPNLYSFAHGGITYRLVRQPARVEIRRGRTRETTEDALRILREAPDLYDFGGALAHVDRGRIRPLDEAALGFHLGGLTQFWRWHTPPKGEPVEVEEDPPPRVVRAILSLGEFRALKRLEAVVTAPTLRPDGSVLAVEGFDAATGLLLEPADDMVPVPDAPDRDVVADALVRLMAPFDLFPLASPVDWGVLLAALLTAVVRPALPTAPAFAFDAPRQGSGKTLLASCVAALASGATPTIWPHTAGKDDEEVRKRLTTMLRTGERALVWDNVVGTFDSAALAGALTAPVYVDRVLGASEAVTLPNRALLLLTGNNMALSGDLVRRVLICRIDPQTERPWLRTFDLEPLAYTLAHRQDMASAALTVIRGWLTDQRGKAPGRTASFERWDDLVRQAVAWVAREVAPGEYADPMEAVEAGTAADPDEAALAGLLRALMQRFADGRFSARDLADICRRAGERPAYNSMGDRLNVLAPGEQAIVDALEELAPGSLTARGIGRILNFRRDRLVGGLVLRGMRDKAVGTLWRIQEVAREARAA